MSEGKIVGIVLLVNEVLSVGGNTLSKAAMAKGLNNIVLVALYHSFGFFLLLPFAFFHHRKNPPPPINCSIIMRLAFVGFISYGCSISLFIGINYSSPTLASVMNNLSPAFTFIFAVIFRMEMLKVKSQSSLLKIVGTLASIAGSLIVILYKGFPILQSSSLLLSLSTSQPTSWIIGGIFLFCATIMNSLNYIVKTWVVRDYPSDILVTLISYFIESILATLVAFAVEPDTRVWMPRSFDLKLIAILYLTVQFAFANTVHTWTCRKKGPVFTAMFKPLQIVIAAIMGITLLNDILYFGSVIGGLIIVIGFYIVMKGKVDEEEILVKEVGTLGFPDSESSHRDPLLLPVFNLIEDGDKDLAARYK